MDSAVVAAIIGSLVAFATSILATVNSRRAERGQIRANQDLLRLERRLDEESKQAERELTGRAELDKVREPLLRAAEDLRQRIWNIRESNFFYYLEKGDAYRRETALLGTLHRFARYWALQQVLYSRVNLLLFENEAETRHVGKLVGAISGIFADDRYPEHLHLIFWREEQRAVAELMVGSNWGDSVPEITEFASFSRRYKEDEDRARRHDFARWLADFAAGLQSPEVRKSKRLKDLQEKLEELVVELENGRTKADSSSATT